ncbi:prolyl-tRNA synthetase associated domain-containing protein [Pelagibacterales bacterium SAG-MED31]|nr:prolyl-tRNA synthetase associated domain-containing protein [Pelagibacterales bacterium SAG-MED31]
MLSTEKILTLLNKSKIDFEVNEHKPLFRVEDSKNFKERIVGTHTKNLFLKNKKNEFCLISCEENCDINLKKLSKSLGLGNTSFANEKYMKELLGVLPGSVSPFALMNDTYNLVNFYLEKELDDSELLNFHPLINTATITISRIDFIKFMIENNKKIHIFSVIENVIIRTYE